MPDEQNKQTQNTVATPVQAYVEMSAKWDLIHDLLGGTLRMRQAGAKWLPQEPNESWEAYKVRLKRSVLYEGFKDTVKKLVARPFAKPVGLTEEPNHEQLNGIENDVDRTGQDLTEFASSVMTAGVVYGLTHILVDFPAMQAETLADEREQGNRPVFVHIEPWQLIGWRIGDDGQLEQIRIWEQRTEPQGDYGDQTQEYVRVINMDTWELHKKVDEDKWELEDQGPHTFGSVPLITYYTNRTGPMTADPPLEALAWMNLAHWQSMSDQRNILRFARVPMLFGAGFTDEEREEGFTIGPTRTIMSTNSDASLNYVEHSGHAIEAGENDLDKLEQRMEMLGMQPLVERSKDSTATGKQIDEGRSMTTLQRWVQDLGTTIVGAYELAGQWVGTTLPQEFDADIYSDFGVTERTAEEGTLLHKIRKGRDIDQRTFLLEIRRRGILAEDTDVDDVMERAEAEEPALGSMTGMADPTNPENPDDE